MANEAYQAIVRHYYNEVWSQGHLDLIDTLVAPQYANHDPATPGVTIQGRDAFKGLVASYRVAFPDLRFTIEDQFSDSDRVVSRWTAQGTQQGALMGLPPTGRSAAIEGITLTRFADGLIVEDHVIWDTLGLLQQLGVVPAAA